VKSLAVAAAVLGLTMASCTQYGSYSRGYGPVGYYDDYGGYGYGGYGYGGYGYRGYGGYYDGYRGHGGYHRPPGRSNVTVTTPPGTPQPNNVIVTPNRPGVYSGNGFQVRQY